MTRDTWQAIGGAVIVVLLALLWPGIELSGAPR